jgi:type II secretory pathway pseudopilin PulG
MLRIEMLDEKLRRPEMSNATDGVYDSNSGTHTRRARRDSGLHGRGRKPRHTVRNILIAVLLLLLVLAGIAAFSGYKLYREAQEVKAHEQRAMTLLSSVQNVDQLQDSQAIATILPQLQSETSAAKTITDGTLWKIASALPVYGDDITTVRGLATAVDSLSNEALPKLSETVSTMLSSSLSGGNGAINLQPIADAQSGFKEANASLQSELSTLKALPEPHLSQVKEPYDLAIQQFTSVSDKIDQVNSLIQVLPKFLGQDGSRNYLIVAQTTSEARSSGGLIGSLGTFSANKGTITVGDFHPNSDFVSLGGGNANADEESVFKSPLDLAFDIRDLAAFPDFSRTATTVNALWQRSAYSSTVDGVMMIDPVFVQDMIKLGGNVTLPNGQQLTGDNTAEFLLNGIYKTVPVAQQDAYFEYAASAAMNNIFSNMTAKKMISMAQSFTSLASQRHLYLYSFHKDDAASFQGSGLAKETPSSETEPEIGIYLNQNNPSKLDWYLHRSTTITRNSCNADGSQSYHVEFTANNTLTQSEMATANSYILGGVNGVGSSGTSVEKILFYAPQGGSISNFTVTANAEKPSQVSMNGKKLWMSLATIAPGKSVTYAYDVTTSSKATADLTLDQTPMGWADPGVTYDTKACAIK